MQEAVVITGGAMNIGRAIADRAAADGYTPIVLDVAEPEGPADGIEFRKVDLSDQDNVEAAMRDVAETFNPTRLVNNVGVVKPETLDELDFESFETVMNLNVRPAIQCAKALLPGMRSAGFGRVVNIASRTVLGKEKRTNYASSKAALVGMARSWALELAAFGITSNVVAPGTIGTSAFFRNNPPEEPSTKAIIDGIPAKRIGTGDDVANAVSFFLSERASFVNGQVLYVCGGLTAGRAPV